MNTLSRQVVIENVLQYKMRGKVAYLGSASASIAINFTYVKPFDHPSGKGYQRPVDPKRCQEFCDYLSGGDDALFTPILLNASSNWEFSSYDKYKPSYGRLICKAKASLMDGQHRLGGIKKYIGETNSDLNVPFLAFHYLDEDEEIKFFDIINTKAKGIGSSLSRYLRRDSDEISWIATELLIRRDSPFFSIGSIVGRRNKGRHITLQNLYKTIHFLTKEPNIAILSKEEKMALVHAYYYTIKENFPNEWNDYKGHRMTHIVCLDALSLAGAEVLSKSVQENKRQYDINGITRSVKRLRKVDWSTTGGLRFLKGISGSKSLAEDLKSQMLQ